MFSVSLLDLRYQNKNISSHLVKQPSFAAAATFSAKMAQEHIPSLGKSDLYGFSTSPSTQKTFNRKLQIEFSSPKNDDIERLADDAKS